MNQLNMYLGPNQGTQSQDAHGEHEAYEINHKRAHKHELCTRGWVKIGQATTLNHNVMEDRIRVMDLYDGMDHDQGLVTT